MAQEASQLTPQGAVDSQVVPKLVAMQVEYAEKIREASARGDVDAIQKLLGELTALSQQLAGDDDDRPHLTLVEEGAAAGAAAPPPPMKRRVYDDSLCKLDLDAAVYDGDRDHYLALIDDEAFGGVLEQLLGQAPPDTGQRQLPKAELRLTRMLAPKLFEQLDRCRRSLGLELELGLRVCPDARLAAVCSPPLDGMLVLRVTSALLDRLAADELVFVLGREIGHAILQHHRLPVGFLLRHGRGRLTPLHALRLAAWQRSAELSADRVGLIAARDVDAAASALLKLASGVTGDALGIELREYVERLREAQPDAAGQELDPEDWFSSTPFGPLRLKALALFARSETYLGLTERDAGNAELSEEQLEFELKKTLWPLEPSYLQASTETEALMRDFVFLGSYLACAGQGGADPAARSALGSLLGAEEGQARVATAVSAGARAVKEQLGKLAETLRSQLTPVARLNLVKDLTVVASAQGAVAAPTVECLREIAASLGVRGGFVERVLSQSKEEGGDGYALLPGEPAAQEPA